MARSRIEFLLPPDEKQAIREIADSYGVTMSAYLRIIAIEHQERLEREAIQAKSHPGRTRSYPDEP